MITISQATYNPELNAVSEKEIKTFKSWDKGIIDCFEDFVSKEKPVYLWGDMGNIPIIIAISKKYKDEYKKIRD